MAGGTPVLVHNSGCDPGVRPTVKWSRPDWDGWKHVQETHREGAVEYLKDPLNKGVFSGKFVKGEELKKRLQEVIDNGRASPNTMGREGTVYEYDFHKRIGRLSTAEGGREATAIRVIILDDGTLKTAHPI